MVRPSGMVKPSDHDPAAAGPLGPALGAILSAFGDKCDHKTR